MLQTPSIRCQKLHVVSGNITQLILLVRAIYAFEFPLFSSHRNRENNVIVNLSTMGICQVDPLGGALFISIHFRTLHYIINHFLFYLFPSIVDDIHIIGPPSIISSTYEHFQIELCVIGLFIQP
jgi:hypothetical protein